MVLFSPSNYISAALMDVLKTLLDPVVVRKDKQQKFFKVPETVLLIIFVLFHTVGSSGKKRHILMPIH